MPDGTRTGAVSGRSRWVECGVGSLQKTAYVIIGTSGGD